MRQGLWWLPAAGEAIVAPASGTGALAAAGGGANAGGPDAQLLRLAAAARMNTDVRRAVFCCVMGAEDATDAFERLLRLGLKARIHAPWQSGTDMALGNITVFLLCQGVC